MALTYAKPLPLGSADPTEFAIRLAEVVAEAISWLEELPEDCLDIAPAAGKWCAKEVMGHLIDSAVNNLQRLVRLEIVLDVEPDVRAEPYEQEAWVAAQHYRDKNWMQVLTLWIVLNEHIAWTMRHVPRGHLSRLCIFPDTHMTFGFLLADYIAHMEHHLNALKTWLEAGSDSPADGV